MPELPRIAAAVVAAGVLTVGCGDDDAASPTTALPPEAPTSVEEPPEVDAEQPFPDVIAAEVTPTESGLRFDVTVSSPYDSPARYADAWRVRGQDGTQFAVRELAHDHASEQPFTRSLDAVQLPPDVAVVVIEGRDLVNGWGGSTVEVAVPESE